MLLGTLLGYITFIFRKNKKANYYDTKKRHYLLVYFLLLTLVIGILLLSTGMLYNIKQADLVGVILMVSSIILLKLQGWKYQKP